MTLTSAWALALAALAAPVIAMYLYKLHREKRAVASSILLRAIRDDRPASRRSRSKLRHRLSLALVLVALLLAIGALAGPRSTSGSAERVVIVLDRSASMGTRDGSSTRLDAAAAAATDVIERIGPETELALVAIGGDAGLVIAPTREHADVADAIRRLRERQAFGDNRDDALAFQVVAGLCRSGTRVIVITDGAGSSVPASTCPSDTIAIGRAAPNVGITALSARSLDGLGTYAVHIGVASSVPEPRTVDVRLALAGEVIDVQRFDIPPRAGTERTIKVMVPPSLDENRTLSAELASWSDALPLDDQASLALGDASRVSVLLVTERKNSLVGEALRLHPRVDLELATSGQIAATPRQLVVLETAPASALPPAPKVVTFGVDPGGDSPIRVSTDPAKPRAITRWEFEAPWFRFVDLRELLVAKSRLVTGGHAIVDSDSGAVAATATWGDRELIVAGFAIDETDLTLRASFPNLIANLVDWAAPDSPPSAARGVLSVAETDVTPTAPTTATGELSRSWHGGASLIRILLALALTLLLLEQIVHLVPRTRGSARRVA